MKQKILIIILISIFTLSACKDLGNEVKENTKISKDNIKEIYKEDEKVIKFKNKLENLQKSGKLPKLDRSDSLLGPDENNNGVRDDVEAWIEKKFPTQIPESMQFARNLQGILSINLDSKQELEKHYLVSVRSINCLINVRYDKNNKIQIHPLAIMTELRKVTFNTKKRLDKYLKHSQARNGSHGSTSDAKGDTCE